MLDEIIILGQSTSWLEVIAMITGIVGVWLTMKENIWCFPVGIINVSFYAWLFMTPGIRLYADSLLQCFYVLLLIYGWLNWGGRYSGNPEQTFKISKSNAIRMILLSLAGTFLLGLFLSRFTDASYPWLDSLLTCFSLAAQWMIARKMIENWIVWIIVNIIYLPLYILKNLPLTAILYGVFLILAFKGYREWKKNLINREL